MLDFVFHTRFVRIGPSEHTTAIHLSQRKLHVQLRDHHPSTTKVGRSSQRAIEPREFHRRLVDGPTRQLP